MPYKICINAGHGPKGVNNSSSNGIDPGAIGPSGYKEYIETKEIADSVSTKLKFNRLETLVIQDGDLWDVTNQSNAWKSDYFISIHCNSYSDYSANGVETFSLASTGKGRMLAESIHKELVPATGLFDRGLKTANYHVLRETDCPAILTEIGFISNPKEEALMKDSVWDDKVSSSIAKGICNFLGIKYVEKQISTPPSRSNQSIQSTNNKGDNNMLNTCILLFSKDDFWSGNDVAEKNGNCAIFIRHIDKTCPKEAFLSKQLIIIGGPDIPTHPNRIYLSGNTKFDTVQKVAKYLSGNK